MKLHRALFALALTSGLVTGCDGGDDDGTNDAGVTDTGRPDTGAGGDTGIDAGVEDTGADAGTDAGVTDTGSTDAGVVDIRIPQLSGQVQVDFDDLGVLHASCQTDEDCVAVQGYFHAAHRFGQMDLRRRVVKGRLAEVLPLQPGIDSDRRYRTLISTREGMSLPDQLWAASSTRTRTLVEAYTRGVNAWIEDFRNGANGAELTDEWRHLRDQIEDWEPTDSIACALALVEGLTNSSQRELALGDVYATASTTLAADLFSLRPASPSAIITNEAFTALDPEALDKLASVQARLQMAQPAIREALRMLPEKSLDIGSNNWVLGPSRSADNQALLANDPHLGLSFPSVWYLAHLDAKTNGTGDLHIAGASFAGLPGVLIGQNEDIAWGATTTFFDMSDVYVETLNQAGDAVIFNGQEVPIVERTYQIAVTGGQPVMHTVRYVPHHGPILVEDPQNGMALSLRWTGQDATTDANYILEMALATSVTEARTALENITTLGQNWVVIDRDGNFGWFPYNRVPRRPWASPLLPSWVPVPGDGSAEWQGAVPYAELPQALNPPDGYIATANNDMTGHLADGDPTNDGQEAFQALLADGYRHERIVQRIQDGMNTHSLETMQSIQADVHSLIGQRVVGAITGAAAGGALLADGQAVVSALESWDFDCPTGLLGLEPSSMKDPDPGRSSSSIGCTAFHAVWPRLIDLTFGDELEEEGVGAGPRTSAMVFALLQPDALIGDYWDDVSTTPVETMQDIVVAAINDAAMWMVGNANLGANSDDWRWGRIHTVTLIGDIFPPNSDTFANDGGLYTVDVANPRFGGNNSDFSHGSGPSMRFACRADSAEGVRCTIELPGGQRHFSDSPHATDMFMRWLVNEPAPIHFTAAEVAGASVETVLVNSR